MHLIESKDLYKAYKQGQVTTPVLKGINLTVSSGDFISIVGPSGSGKTTLLYVLSGLEPYNKGNLLLYNQELSTYKRKDITKLRQSQISFVFQFYHLIPSLTVYENVQLATVISGKNHDIDSVLADVGLLDVKHDYPSQLSGGMQQRVAIARSLINDPDIIFADEPIGNLDQKNGHMIMEIFKTLNQKYKKTIILVTHNEEMIQYGNRVIRLRDGVIEQDEIIHP